MSTILRKRLKNHWTGIPNVTIRDRAISFRATGVLAFLLSMDDGWSMDSSVIAERKGNEGRDAVRSALRELRDAGYVRHVKLRQQGRFVTEVEVCDEPVEEWKGGVLVDLTTAAASDGISGAGGAPASDGIPGPGLPTSGEPTAGGSGDQGDDPKDHTPEGPQNTEPLVDSVDAPERGFEKFWEMWPKRHGKKIGKRDALRIWKRLPLAEKRLAYRGAVNYRAASDANLAGAMDAHRWLTRRLWEDWQDPAEAPRRTGRPGEATTDTLREAWEAERRKEEAAG